MPSYDPVTAHAYAGLLAASSAVAANRAVRRPPVPGVVPRGIRLPGVQDAPHLFEATHGSADRDHKLARVAAASLLYTMEKRPGGYAEQVLAPGERAVLRDVHADRHQGKGKDLRCRYCHLSGALYAHVFNDAVALDSAPPSQRFFVVRHSATVQTNFDPDTFISTAQISDYQVLVPASVATLLVSRSHPLSWHDAAPNLFLVSAPAEFVKNEWRPGQSIDVTNSGQDDARKKWEDDARGRGAYLYERVSWPLSTDAISTMDNAIRVSAFTDYRDERSCSLAYDYGLESCIDSDFAIIRESGGIDVDGGHYAGRACRAADIKAADLKGMTRRDLDQLKQGSRAAQVAAPDAPASPLLTNTELGAEALPALLKKITNLEIEEREPWWLVTLTTSKRLRFTAPGATPVDLWAALTWICPALLFTFVNRAVCQAAAEITGPAAPGPVGVGHNSVVQTRPPGPGSKGTGEAPHLASARREAYKRSG
jgi:hypothetical protein